MTTNNYNSVEENLKNNHTPSEIKMSKIPNDIKSTVKNKDNEKLQKDLEKISDEIKKKYKFVTAISLAPAQASKVIEEEFEVEEKYTKKGLVHLLIIVPENKYKDISKIKSEIILITSKINEKIWVHLFTPIDFWNFGLDSKFELFEAFSMSFPFFDKNNFLASLRISQIHKNLVLRKFEKYVTAYVIGGSFVRGDSVKSSDVDVFVVIDDTDVKKMGRIELLEKLRGIILSFVRESMSIGGAKIDLNVQTYLMTDFWESIKDAHPIMFTFIRDGIPMYDRGAFLPWKNLLRSGRIKPSPEAIEMFMSTGDKLREIVDRKLLDIVIHDLYWSTLTPSQGLLMLYGSMPQGPRDTSKSLREIFVNKEKLLEEKYADTLDEIAVKYYKGFEHGKIKPKDINGEFVDRLTKDAINYIKRLKELRWQIEKRNQEKSINEIYNDLFGMLSSILHEKEEASIMKQFDKNFIKTGNFPRRYLENIKYVVKICNEFNEYIKVSKEKIEKEKGTKYFKEIEKVRRLSSEVMNALIEYTQRCDFLFASRNQFSIKDKKVNIIFLKDTFILSESNIRKIVNNKIVDSNAKDLESQMSTQINKKNKINFKDLEILKKEFGNFELEF